MNIINFIIINNYYEGIDMIDRLDYNYNAHNYIMYICYKL